MHARLQLIGTIWVKNQQCDPQILPFKDVLNRSTGPRRAEVQDLLDLFREVSGEEPVVWAGRIIGFGEYRYT